MTDQPRTACQTCFQHWAPEGRRRCPDCDPAQRVIAKKRARPKLDITDFSGQSLDGLNINDFIDTAELP
ncbi:MAG: hypothetical protein ACLP5J_09615 [Mycobacterium sp.]|uniref:hypothetical protein n=1 Tax=Mycobacterium sp. TaxID=1785 RepID=UPI003F9DE6B9